MWAPWPTAGATFAFEQLFAGATDTFGACLRFFGRFNPANKLILGQWRNRLPQFMYLRVGNQRLMQIIGERMGE
jgi:hypothetical protein